MLSTECVRDLNEVMNDICRLAGQYKACMRDFMASGDHGIAVFLKAEAMERWEMTEKIADFIQEFNGSGVLYAATPSPLHGPARPAVLQSLVQLEKSVVDRLDTAILAARSRGADITKQKLIHLKYDLQKEYNEVLGVVNNIISLSTDAAGMLYYDNFLAEMYKRGYE